MIEKQRRQQQHQRERINTMPRLIREESQEVTTAPPPKQQGAIRPDHQKKKVTPTPKLTKNEKRKQSPVHHGIHQSSSSTQKKKTRTQKKKKDPNEPTHPRSAYNFYTKDARPKIVATGVSVTSTVNSQLGEQWRAMSAVDKLPYERMAIDDKGRYTEEKAAYDAKNKSVAESNNKVGGGTTVPLSYPVKMGEQKHVAALTHARSADNASDVKMKYAEVINTEVVFKKEANVANNDVPSSASQKSPESVDVDLLVDPQEKLYSLKKEEENDVPTNTGNKENNNAPSSKVGKGLKGLGKSLAKAKSGVTRLFNSKSKSQEEEKSSKSRTVVRAGSYTAVVNKSESSSNDPESDAKVKSGEVANGKSHSGETEGDKKVRHCINFCGASSEVCILSHFICSLYVLIIE